MTQTQSRYRLDPDSRRQHILSVAVELAQKDSFEWLTRAAVAEAACVSPGLVSAYFKPFTELKREVLREAVRTKNIDILAQGMAARHPLVANLPMSLRDKVAKRLTAIS